MTLVLLLLVQFDAEAQCAMCKLNAENAARENNGFAEGLNNGIIYLMGIPYGLLALGVIVFYRSFIRKKRS